MTSDYVELHSASAFSFLQGASQPEKLVERAVEIGMPALALLVWCPASSLNNIMPLTLGSWRFKRAGNPSDFHRARVLHILLELLGHHTRSLLK